MSAYLTFFELEQSPFEGKAQSQVVLGTRALRGAFGTIRSGLEGGASRICVSGGAGLGKTSLARALPKLLGDAARVANVIDPSMGWEDCRGGLAKQWGLDSGVLARGALIEARSQRPLVVVIDQAERASEEFLDHLDVLLSYRTEADEAVVQSVLLANLGTQDGERPVALVWWLDRIQTLQLEFEPLPRDGVASYVTKHLRRAGWRGEALFTEEAGFAVHGYTGGVPGEISELCERLLIEAASREQSCIDADFVHATCEPEPDQEEASTADADADPSDDDDAWTIPDEFEALMGEEEFAAAGDPVDEEPDEEPRPDAAADAELADDATSEAEPAAVASDGSMDAESEPEEEAAPSLAAALEFFESAATADPEEACDDPEPAPPIELSEVAAPVDHPEIAYDAPNEDVDRGGPWTDGEDEASEPIELSRPSVEPEWTDDDAAEMDAAIVPAAAPSPYELTRDPAYDSPFDDDLTAPPGTGWLLGFKKLAGVAIAAAIGGIAFLSFGGDDTPEAGTLAVQRETPTGSEANPNAPSELRAFAAPAQGFVDPTALDALPSEVLEQVHDITARVESVTFESDPRPSARAAAESTPVEVATTPAPEPASSPRAVDPAPVEPAVASASDPQPEVRFARDVVEDSPGASATESPIAGTETAESVPAAPGDTVEEERFW